MPKKPTRKVTTPENGKSAKSSTTPPERGTAVSYCSFQNVAPAANAYTADAVVALADAVTANAKAISQIAQALQGPAFNAPLLQVGRSD